MTKPQLKLAILILILPLTVAAKTPKLFPGYFLNMQGDTVKCNFEIESWSRNPLVVHASNAKGPLELRPEETMGFGVYGYSDYTSGNVTYHSAPINGTNLPDKFSDKTETKWCFLKSLANGKFNLYKLVTPERIIFFVSDHGTVPTELVYRVAFRDNQELEDLSFHDALISYFNEEGMGETYDGRIRRAKYKEDDLLGLVKILDGNQMSNSHAGRKSSGFESFVLGGARMYTFPSSFNGTHSLTEQFSVNNHFSPALGPLAGFGVYYNLSPQTEKFWLGLSVDYSSYEVSVTKSGTSGRHFSQNAWDSANYSEHMHGSNAFATLNLFTYYVLNPDNKVRYYLKAGVWYSFSVSSNSDIYSDYTAQSFAKSNGIPGPVNNSAGQATLVELSKSFGDFLIGTGAALGQNRLELYCYLPSFTGRFNGTGTKFKIGSLSLAYIYGFKWGHHSNAMAFR